MRGVQKAHIDFQQNIWRVYDTRRCDIGSVFTLYLHLCKCSNGPSTSQGWTNTRPGVGPTHLSHLSCFNCFHFSHCKLNFSKFISERNKLTKGRLGKKKCLMCFKVLNSYLPFFCLYQAAIAGVFVCVMHWPTFCSEALVRVPAPQSSPCPLG